ncbi:hypothetical protein [Variovorax sp. YR216]|uniref:hypothetical protein n=1 Tax=Variovorax sp. YR216 TaxID=1882828 RepID=UPI00089758B7|nr:hypothetical protein [Variovorax sp. YR216]SEA11451.1 hypothetical protein SAMN05444680_101558 [Variovorax sp. YR216]
MHAKLHPKRALDHERAVCEPWRGSPGRFIVVLPLPQSGGDHDTTRFDLDVLVVQQADNGNTERAKIVSRLLDEGALTEDASHIAEIRLDTARYTLAPDARAFGLRVIYQGSSRTSPYARETLTLYLPQGQKLAKVLEELEMTLERGEWDANCTGNFDTTRGTLSVMRAASNGLADLTLRRTRSGSRNLLQGEECITQERPATFSSIVLRFDGTLYRMPKRAARD